MVCNNRIDVRSKYRQTGATLVEFTLTFLIFTTLVFAIIEFSMATFNWSRTVQATHAGARYAITGDPACDIFSYRDEAFIPNCDGGGVLDAACAPGDEVHRTITSCTEGSTDSGCKIVEQMQRYSPYILSDGGSVTVSYTCTQTGDPDLPRAVPIVTVSSDNVPYQFMMPGLFNIDASITMPSFSTTRIGEDLHTYIPPAP